MHGHPACHAPRRGPAGGRPSFDCFARAQSADAGDDHRGHRPARGPNRACARLSAQSHRLPPEDEPLAHHRRADPRHHEPGLSAHHPRHRGCARRGRLHGGSRQHRQRRAARARDSGEHDRPARGRADHGHCPAARSAGAALSRRGDPPGAHQPHRGQRRGLLGGQRRRVRHGAGGGAHGPLRARPHRPSGGTARPLHRLHPPPRLHQSDEGGGAQGRPAVDRSLLFLQRDRGPPRLPRAAGGQPALHGGGGGERPACGRLLRCAPRAGPARRTGGGGDRLQRHAVRRQAPAAPHHRPHSPLPDGRMLLARLRDPHAPIEHVTLRPELVVRDSTGRAPRTSSRSRGSA